MQTDKYYQGIEWFFSWGNADAASCCSLSNRSAWRLNILLLLGNPMSWRKKKLHSLHKNVAKTEIVFNVPKQPLGSADPSLVPCPPAINKAQTSPFATASKPAAFHAFWYHDTKRDLDPKSKSSRSWLTFFSAEAVVRSPSIPWKGVIFSPSFLSDVEKGWYNKMMLLKLRAFYVFSTFIDCQWLKAGV